MIGLTDIWKDRKVGFGQSQPKADGLAKALAYSFRLQGKCAGVGLGSEKPEMTDGTARSVELPPAAHVRRAMLRLVGEADGGALRARPVLPPPPLPPLLSPSIELFGISPFGWIGAAAVFAALATAGLWLASSVTPPMAWPQDQAIFRVIFEPSPAPAPPPIEAALPAPPEPVSPPPETDIVPPEPAPPPPLVVAAPAELLPLPPPPKPEPRPAAPKLLRAPAAAAALLPVERVEPAPAPQTAAVATIPPRPISSLASNRKPDYPQEARRRGLQGKVLLHVEVSPQGMPLSVAVATSSGYGPLDQAALVAVERWRFTPATRDGAPVAGAAEVPIQFRLEE
jgi:periplasmic protein TonB